MDIDFFRLFRLFVALNSINIRIEVHFYSFHWEMKGHWSRVNLVKCFFPCLYKMPVSADCSISLKTEKDMHSLSHSRCHWSGGNPHPPMSIACFSIDYYLITILQIYQIHHSFGF